MPHGHFQWKSAPTGDQERTGGGCGGSRPTLAFVGRGDITGGASTCSSQNNGRFRFLITRKTEANVRDSESTGPGARRGEGPAGAGRAYQRRAILMGVVRQEVNRSAGRSGIMGRSSLASQAASWMQFFMDGGRGIWARGWLGLMAATCRDREGRL